MGEVFELEGPNPELYGPKNHDNFKSINGFTSTMLYLILNGDILLLGTKWVFDPNW